VTTGFADLDAFLARFTEEVAEILGDDLVGLYLSGSFALGAGDLQSDVDFVAVTRDRPSPEHEQALRTLHDEIPTRLGHWPHDLEGSYAPVGDLRTLDTLGGNWLYVDRGHREMQWDWHCNRPEHRWVLREHGIPLVGPPAREFTAPVPTDLLRQAMVPVIETCIDDISSWANWEVAWTQRYAVTSLCRMLFTLETGTIASKPAALEWALTSLAPEWQPLIRQAIDDRPRPWDDPPRPSSVERTQAFAGYAVGLARERAV
jgi:hypothetical protein